MMTHTEIDGGFLSDIRLLRRIWNNIAVLRSMGSTYSRKSLLRTPGHVLRPTDLWT